MMWLGMVQNGESSTEQEKGEEDDTRSFKKRIRRNGGSCNRKPQILFWYNTNFKCYFGDCFSTQPKIIL